MAGPVSKQMHIVITGGSSGIGAALAGEYASEDIHLTLTGRNSDRLAAVASACRAKGARVETKVISVIDRAAMAEFLEQIDNDQPIDLLIANAGISGDTSGVPESGDRAAAILDVNIHGVLNTIDPILPRMLQRKSGQIALLSSLAGFKGMPSAPAYSASKAWVRSYGEGLRGRYAKKGVGVSVICPGFVASRITDANEYPMPMYMASEPAARIIKKGLAKNKSRIAFPLPLYLLVWFLSVIPVFVSDRLLSRLPAKE